MDMLPELKLTIVIEKGEQGWLVGQIAEMPGVMTQGKTVEETKENLLDALQEYLVAQRQDHDANAMNEVLREELKIA
jgi:predicted RNase H-like HicB family nuclease